MAKHLLIREGRCNGGTVEIETEFDKYLMAVAAQKQLERDGRTTRLKTVEN